MGTTASRFCRHRPCLELLEDRCLPAQIIVTNPFDTIASGDGVSLREAIQAANTDTAVNEAKAGDPGLDTIAFDPSLAGSPSPSPTGRSRSPKI
jgi:hypothetical protein